MAWYDNWDDFTSGVGSVVNNGGLNTAVNLGTAAYDIYSGLQNQARADKMYDIVYGTAAQQDAWAKEISDRTKGLYWPLEDLQFQYGKEDATALRPSDVANRDYNIQRRGEVLNQARVIDPMLDANKQQLLGTLTQSTGDLRDRLMTEASANVDQAFDQSRAEGMRRFGLAGFNPSSGALADYSRTMDQGEALAQATARTKAARSAEDIGLSRQSQALNYQAGIPLPQYQTTPSVTAGTVGSALGGSGTLASNAASGLDTRAQNAFTGAATSLNNLYWNPIQSQYTNALTNQMNSYFGAGK